MCVYGYHFPIVSSVYYLVSLYCPTHVSMNTYKLIQYLQSRNILQFYIISFLFLLVYMHRSGGRPEHYIDSSWAKLNGALFLFIKFLLEYSHTNLFYVFSMAGFEVIKHKNSKIFVTQTLIIQIFSHLHLHEVQY